MYLSSAFKKLQNSTTPEKVQLLLDTHSLHQVYKTLGVSDQLLLKYIDYYKLSYQKSYRTLRDLGTDTISSILDDWCNSCLTKREIGKKYNLGPKALNRLLKEKEVENRSESAIDPELVQYQKLVRRLTRVVLRHYQMKAPPGYEWDHKFSVKEGYQQNVHPSIIASRENLQLITISENRSNGHECSISRDELINSVCQMSL
jgi:hypothetical protein